MNDEMFDMAQLAKAYQEILGDRYYSIDIYSNLSLGDNVVQGLMRPYRRPFKLEGIKSETIELSFEFFIDVRKKEAKLDELKTLSKICGYKKGTFASNGKTYKFHSFLDFATPAMSPVVDYGSYTQCVCIVGTCLVTEPGGALVGNEIKTELTINPDTENAITDELAILNCSYGINKTTETPLMANMAVAKAFNKTQAYTYTYSILVLKNAICERLVKAARNIQPFALNEVVRIKDTYPAFTGLDGFSGENDCIVVNCSLVSSAGAFTVIELSLQDAFEEA